MNQTTSDVIEFLNHPELDLGVNPLDIESLQHPELLREKVESLLQPPPAFLESREAGEDLRARLHQADWALVARELRNRLYQTSRFFDEDARTTKAVQEQT